MKSAPQFILLGLLVALSILAYGCQSEGMPESENPLSQPEENQPASGPAQTDIRSVSVDEIINITWQWTELIENAPAAQSVVADPENYTLIFWDDDIFSFKADCNAGNGTYIVQGRKIEFGPMMTTLAMCPPESLHDQYLALLGEVDTFGMVGDNLVFVLKDAAGEMRFANGGIAEKPKTEPESPASEEKIFYVGPEKVECVGVGPQECYQVKEDPDGEWQLFYDEIEGFTWEPGNTYKLRVAVHPVENPPADGSSLRYELIEVLDQEATNVPEKAAQYIEISQPAEGETLAAGNPILVSGMGAGLFEGNVVVRAEDAAGNILVEQATILDSPEAGIGGEGPWQIKLNVPVDTLTEGQIVAFSPSPKDGEGWLASDQISVIFDPDKVAETALENTIWQLMSFGGENEQISPLLAAHQVTATLNSADSRISGIAGCNRYFGGYSLEGDRLSIEAPVASTRMACTDPQMKVETTYLASLEQVTRYEIMNNSLTMLDADGNIVLSFQVEPYSQTNTFTREELANISYLSDSAENGVVQLTNGEYRAPVAEGSATELVVLLTNFATFGDLDSDGREEAAVILVTNSGGSGTFYDLALVRKQDQALTNFTKILLGDRVQIKSIWIEKGDVVVEMITQGPEDPFCCPTQRVINHYTLENGQLILISSEAIE